MLLNSKIDVDKISQQLRRTSSTPWTFSVNGNTGVIDFGDCQIDFTFRNHAGQCAANLELIVAAKDNVRNVIDELQRVWWDYRNISDTRSENIQLARTMRKKTIDDCIAIIQAVYLPSVAGQLIKDELVSMLEEYRITNKTKTKKDETANGLRFQNNRQV